MTTSAILTRDGFSPRIQSAPVLSGILRDLTEVVWGGASVPVVAAGSRYIATSNTLFAFVVSVGGTIGSTATITITWTSAPDIGSGTLNLGTDHGYVADDAVYVGHGLSLSFGAGTIVASDVLTVAAEAIRIIPADYRRIILDKDPAGLVVRYAFKDKDREFETDDATILRDERMVAATPTITTDWLGKDGFRGLQEMKQMRHEVTIGENYDEFTVFLQRGGASLPMIGSFPNNLANTRERTYRDVDSGYLKIARRLSEDPDGLGDNWIGPGPDHLPKTEATPEHRGMLPDRWHDRTGLSFQVASVTHPNRVIDFHPSVSDDVWVSSSGSPTIAFDKYTPGVLHPDGGWKNKFLQGTLRVNLNGSEAIVLPQFTVTPAEVYSYVVYLRGSGAVEITFQTNDGGGWTTYLSPATFALSVGEDLDPNGHRWIRCANDHSDPPVEVAAGHTLGRIRIRSSSAFDDLDCWISAAGVNIGLAAVEPVQNDGSVLPSALNRLTHDFTPLPKSAGTISFWLFWPTDPHGGEFKIFRTTDDKFRLNRKTDSSTELWEFHTDSTENPLLQPTTVPVNDRNIQFMTWRHVALTWQVDLTGAPTMQLTRRIYDSGALVAEDQSSQYEEWGNAWEFFPSDNDPDLLGCRIADLRIDSRALSTQEIAEIYNRYTNDDWNHMYRSFAGKKFEISAIAGSPVNPVQPGKVSAKIKFMQSGSFPGQEMTRR